MSKVRVYDLPIRVFHWCFAALFVAAYAIANLVDDESSRFSWHMLAGLMLAATVLFRLFWGLVGTRYARFSDFSLRPAELASYLRSVVSGDGRRWVGHNPASSWAALSMMAIALAMGASGVAMALGMAPEWVEEAHELLANALLALALLHLAGLVVHVQRHRDALPASMISGYKHDLPQGTAGVTPRRVAAMLFLLWLLGTGGLMLRGYAQNEGTLQLFGARLELGENRHASGEIGESGHATGEQVDDHERESD